MTHIRRLLSWLRVEDENSQLSLTWVAFAVGCYLLLAGKPVPLPALSAFALTLAGYHAKRVLQHRKARKELEVAAGHATQRLEADTAIALQKRSDDAQALDGRMTALEARIRDLAMPEAMERLRQSMVRK